MSSEPVEFKTFDGTILRGDLYLPHNAGKIPLVIMTHGLTLLKEQYLPNFASDFQKSGIGALVYDHRGYGSSDGLPRSETNIYQQAQDAHDAVTFAASLPVVDPSKVALWGIGHSGGMSIIATALDSRVAAALILMPFTSGSNDTQFFPMDAVWKSRVEKTAEYTKIWPDSKAEAEALPSSLLLPGIEPWEFISGAREMTRKARGEDMPNKLSLQSFYHIALCEPQEYLKRIAPRPLFYLVAETDKLTGPVENHRKVFDEGGEWNGKEWVVMKDHHLGTYVGETYKVNSAAQIDFLKRHF